MADTALILLGHGSHISPHTAGLVWQQVDILRSQGIADEVTAAFWKEMPSFRQVLSTVSATEITLIPLFTARGYFTQTVIPIEMALTGETTILGKKHIRYAPPLANSIHLPRILQTSVIKALRHYKLAADQTTLALIGHGTKRHAESRDATESQANILRQQHLVSQVITAYLDDEPAISTIYERSIYPHIIVIPYFLAMGSHATIDVPEALGLAKRQSVATKNSREQTGQRSSRSL